MADESKVYLVVTDTGIHGTYFDAKLAGVVAEAVEGVLVALPTAADYRTADYRASGGDRG